MKVIFRADDLGYSEGINCGIYKAITDGVITSVGLMPNMEAAIHGYTMVKDLDICLGQHTNLCVGKPVSDPKCIPSLVNKETGMFCSSKEIKQRTKDTIVIEEAEIEIEAQLERFKEITGKNPDYFEGHAIFSTNFFIALKNIAKKHNLFYCGCMDASWCKEVGITCSKFFIPDNNGLYNPLEYLKNDDAKIKGTDCAVLIFHPGYLDQYILENSSFTLIRPMEVAFLCSEELQEWMKENNVTSVDFVNYKE